MRATVVLLFSVGVWTVSAPAQAKSFCGAYKSDAPCQNVTEGSECATDEGKFGACLPEKQYGEKAACRCVRKYERIVEFGPEGPTESDQKCNRDASVEGCRGASVDASCIVQEREGICVPSKQNLGSTTCACVDKPEEKVVTKAEPTPSSK